MNTFRDFFREDIVLNIKECFSGSRKKWRPKIKEGMKNKEMENDGDTSK